MNDTTMLNFSAGDAKACFDEMLDAALASPVRITKDDHVAAYLVSKEAFDLMVDQLQELDDQIWLFKAEANQREGFASAAEVDALMRRLKNELAD